MKYVLTALLFILGFTFNASAEMETDGFSNAVTITTAGSSVSHATDCTGLTATTGTICYEIDADVFYVCEPSAGDCDTAGEWKVNAYMRLSGDTMTGTLDSLAITVAADSTHAIGEDATRYAEIFADSIDIGATGASGVITSPAEAMLATVDMRLTGPAITVGSGTGLTVNDAGSIRHEIYKVTLDYTGLSAAATTAKHTIATLPAGMKIVGVIADTTTKYIGGAISAVTLAVGVDSGNVDEFIEEHDVFAAAIVVGDADVDLGSGLIAATMVSGGYIDWASTTVVSAIIVSTSADTDALTQGSTTYYLETVQVK